MQSRYMERSKSMGREKRPLDPGSSEEGQRDQKRPALASVIVEALKVDSLQKLCSSLEPILRRVVSEEVERALAKLGPTKINGSFQYCGAEACGVRVYGPNLGPALTQARFDRASWVSPKRIGGPDGRNLQLHFRSRLSLPLFTGGKIEGEQGVAIHIVLLDANTGRVVTSGPESSVKLDVVVLEGDFNNEDEESWSQEEFESHIVKEREGKRPLLNGELQVMLKEGIGTLGELTFTDNSSWIRSRKFRLGLKVASGCCEGICIREAKTDAFIVKDHRGELYKKHYPPAFNDEVWRLEKIGKDGSFHKRLFKAGIYTVEDFLRHAVRDLQRLRNILGSGMSNKMWDVLVEHAKTCVLSGKLYIYYPDDVRNVGVVFNNIYELCGLIAGGQYYPSDSLSDSQKVHVDTLVKTAYENWMHVIEYDGESLLSFTQNKNSAASQNDGTVGPQDYSTAFDPQLTLPSLPVSIPLEQPSMNPALTAGGHDVSIGTRYPIQSQNVNLNAPIQFDNPSFSPHNQMINASQLVQPPGSESLLALGLQQPSMSGFEIGGPSNFTSYRGFEDFIPEEEIRMRSHEMLENEDMQHLLHIFNTGSHGPTSTNVLDNGYPYSSAAYIHNQSSNHAFDDRARPSGKAVVGWLKLKAALRWGIFIKKKAAERRAQLVELDDS
ncbi:hypothetical protein CsSME_00030604 [Camellia sinensis var. sinensis]|uniref:Uncharacterized protein n=1 Tax=Camellia sinensis var. sinensis TaxID=542762 RepID=A0A4V3WQ30_CAMSN|nr:hypothetical protein TEA_022506 [Camellia sinensis var. sinensis]